MGFTVTGAPGGGTLQVLCTPYTEGPPGQLKRVGIFFRLVSGPQVRLHAWWHSENTPMWIRHNGYQVGLAAHVKMLQAALEGFIFRGQFSSLKVKR